MAELRPDRIMNVVWGFMAAKTLMTAIELDLFSVLAAGPVDAEALRKRLELHPRSARDFFDTLVALGMLERDGGRFQVAFAEGVDREPEFGAAELKRHCGLDVQGQGLLRGRRRKRGRLVGALRAEDDPVGVDVEIDEAVQAGARAQRARDLDERFDVALARIEGGKRKVQPGELERRVIAIFQQREPGAGVPGVRHRHRFRDGADGTARPIPPTAQPVQRSSTLLPVLRLGRTAYTTWSSGCQGGLSVSPPQR